MESFATYCFDFVTVDALAHFCIRWSVGDLHLGMLQTSYTLGPELQEKKKAEDSD